LATSTAIGYTGGRALSLSVSAEPSSLITRLLHWTTGTANTSATRHSNNQTVAHLHESQRPQRFHDDAL